MHLNKKFSYLVRKIYNLIHHVSYNIQIQEVDLFRYFIYDQMQNFHMFIYLFFAPLLPLLHNIHFNSYASYLLFMKLFCLITLIPYYILTLYYLPNTISLPLLSSLPLTSSPLTTLFSHYLTFFNPLRDRVGCGLGRLPLEIAAKGYSCQGNEYSA